MSTATTPVAIETVTRPVLRQEYTVQVAYLKPENTCGRSAVVAAMFGSQPVALFGPKHEDLEIIGFKWEHWHIDWRFAPTNVYARARRYYPEIEGGEKALVVHAVDVVRVDTAALVMRRHAPGFPVVGAPIKWPARLEAAYADHTLKAGMVCPHRGARLSSCQVAAGCVTCPLHGLQWDVATGALVRRYPEGGLAA